MIEKENAVMEGSSLDARNSITARTRVITPFIEIIAGMDVSGENKACTSGYCLCVTDAEKAKFRRYMTKKIITAAKVLDGFQCSEDGQ